MKCELKKFAFFRLKAVFFLPTPIPIPNSFSKVIIYFEPHFLKADFLVTRDKDLLEHNPFKTA